jgi:hypothetical protein
MKIRKTILLGSLVACAAVAQDVPVATQVDGLVTIGQGANVGLLQPGTPITDGTRIVTGSSGKTTIEISPACTVNVGPGQAFTFIAGKSCDELVASVINVGPGTQFAAVPGRGFVATMMGSGALPVAGVLLAGVVSQRNTPISGQ